MTPQHLQKIIGQKVLVTYRGLILVGKLAGVDPRFGQRDALVTLPGHKRPTKFWCKKISQIK